jgi:hypothetical protein
VGLITPKNVALSVERSHQIGKEALSPIAIDLGSLDEKDHRD